MGAPSLTQFHRGKGGRPPTPIARFPFPGAFKQTTEKSHRLLQEPAANKALSGFSTSQNQSGFRPRVLGGVRFIESTIRSSEKSNSPCRLKCAHVAAEPLDRKSTRLNSSH